MRRAALALLCRRRLAAGRGRAPPSLRRVRGVGVVPVGGSADGERATPRDAAVRAAVARAVESGRARARAGACRPALRPRRPKPPNPAAISTRARARARRRSARLRHALPDPRGPRRAAGALPARRAAPRRSTSSWSRCRSTPRASASGCARRAGWPPRATRDPPSTAELVLEGVNDYRALASVRRLLVEQLGARKALPVEFRRGQAVLAVEGGPPRRTRWPRRSRPPRRPSCRLVPVESRRGARHPAGRVDSAAARAGRAGRR